MPKMFEKSGDDRFSNSQKELENVLNPEIDVPIPIQIGNLVKSTVKSLIFVPGH